MDIKGVRGYLRGKRVKDASPGKDSLGAKHKQKLQVKKMLAKFGIVVSKIGVAHK